MSFFTFVNQSSNQMAIIKFSAMVSDVRGTIGGNVFSRNKGGSYVRTYVKPNNPKTTAQAAVRSLFGALASAWRSLTQAQRNAWNAIVDQYPYQDKLGNSKIYSGEQLYIKLNSNLNAAGLPQLVEPIIPVSFPSFAMSEASVSATAGEAFAQTLFNGSAEVPAGFSYIVEATDNLSVGIDAPQRGLFKQIAVLAETKDTSAENIYARYTAVFGAPQIGSKVFYRGRLVSELSGEASTFAQAACIVA